MRFFKILILSSSFIFPCEALANSALEATVAGNYRKFEDSSESEVGLGARLRYTWHSSSGLGYILRAHFEEHALAPALIPGVSKRWGKSTFFEIGVGLYIGTLVDRGIALAIMPTLGFELTNKWFIAVNLYYDTNGDPWATTYMPFIGYKF